MRGFIRVARVVALSLGAVPLSVSHIAAQGASVGNVVNYSAWGGIIRGSALTEGATGMPVAMGDKIRTAGAKGKIELLFVDDTKFVVGQDSEAVIDEFVFNSDRTASRFVIEAAKGSFRFITGESPKTAYQVNTRTATLGFRGTIVDISNLPNGTTALAVYGDGEADLCSPGGRNCVTIAGPCGLGVTGFFQRPRVVESVEERNELLSRNFPYLPDPEQQRLRQEFRAPTSDCGDFSSITPPTITGSISTGDSDNDDDGTDDRGDRDDGGSPPDDPPENEGPSNEEPGGEEPGGEEPGGEEPGGEEPSESGPR